MSIAQVFQSARKTIEPHIPTILTAAAGIGVIGTTGVCIKNTLTANDILRTYDREHPEAETKDRILKVLPTYIPTIVMASTTIACIVGVRTTSKAQTAALASAYTIARETANLYHEKVAEVLGEERAKEVDDAVKDQQLKDHPVSKQPVVVGDGEVLCFDTLSSRYFMSDMNSLERIENLMNKQLLDEMWVSLNEFYYHIGLDPMNLGEELGWDTDHMIHLKFGSRLSDSGKPCLVVDYENEPIADFYRKY